MNTAVIAAAGSGSRMKLKTNKQFLPVGSIPVLSRTLMKFSDCKSIDNIIIAARKEDIESIEALIDEYNIKKVTAVIEGGATRQQSVFKALKEAENSDVVLIHDGARPFFSEILIERLIENALTYGGAAPGIMPKDTIAVVSEDGCFESSTVRSKLRQMQTPQVFKTKLIISAHSKAGEDAKEFTDDCSLFCFYGGKVRVIEGEQSNIKITVPTDIQLAEIIAEEK